MAKKKNNTGYIIGGAVLLLGAGLFAFRKKIFKGKEKSAEEVAESDKVPTWQEFEDAAIKMGAPTEGVDIKQKIADGKEIWEKLSDEEKKAALWFVLKMGELTEKMKDTTDEEGFVMFLTEMAKTQEEAIAKFGEETFTSMATKMGFTQEQTGNSIGSIEMDVNQGINEIIDSFPSPSPSPVERITDPLPVDNKKDIIEGWTLCLQKWITDHTSKWHPDDKNEQIREALFQAYNVWKNEGQVTLPKVNVVLPFNPIDIPDFPSFVQYIKDIGVHDKLASSVTGSAVNPPPILDEIEPSDSPADTPPEVEEEIVVDIPPPPPVNVQMDIVEEAKLMGDLNIFKVGQRGDVNNPVADFYLAKSDLYGTEASLPFKIGSKLAFKTEKNNFVSKVDYIWTKADVPFFIIQTVPARHNATFGGVENQDGLSTDIVGYVKAIDQDIPMGDIVE